MSEYQYYEFFALDKPLSQAQMQELATVSSRAEISSTRFANVYHYGDFRGNVHELMARYFDAMVYVANWGTHRFMLRLPGDLVDQALLKHYCAGESAAMSVRGESVVLDVSSQLEDYGGWEEGEGWLSALAPLRAELLKGDLRALYLAWLLCAQCEELGEDAQEPPLPPGLQQLSGALESLVEYLRLDSDLVAAAAEQSGELEEGLPSGIEEWIAALPEVEKDDLLLKLVQGQDPQIGARLLRRYRSATESATGIASTPRRTVGELLHAAKQQRDARKQAEARRKAEVRARYLDDLASRENVVWQHIEDLVDRKQAKPYDEAVDLLKDLKELSQSRDKTSQFEQRLGALCERHQKKRGFIDRLKQAHLR